MLKEAIAEMLEIHKRLDELPPSDTKEWAQTMDILDGEWLIAKPHMESIARANPDEAWDIFRNGSDVEFAVLVNSVMDIGSAFATDDALREVMLLAKQRGTPEVLKET